MGEGQFAVSDADLNRFALVKVAFEQLLGKWVFDILYFVGEQRVKGVELLQQLLLWSPLSAAVTAAVGVLLLFLMRPLLEPTPA